MIGPSGVEGFGCCLGSEEGCKGQSLGRVKGRATDEELRLAKELSHLILTMSSTFP